jgi:hypothetical protein
MNVSNLINKRETATEQALFTEEDYNIDNLLDENHLQKNEISTYQQIIFLIIYSVIFLLSIVGNSTLLITICRRKRMRTVHNYFLANITISNLIYTLCAPFPFILELKNNNNNEWIYFDFLCPIIPLFNTIAINLNTITMIVSSIDRLIAIICPFRTKLRKSKCILIIFIIWIISIMFSLPWGYLFNVTSYLFYDDLDNKLNTNKLCGLKSLDYKRLVEYYFLFLCFIQYFLPLIILCITFSMIAYYVNVVNAKNIKLDANKLNKNIRRKNETKVSLYIYRNHLINL